VRALLDENAAGPPIDKIRTSIQLALMNQTPPGRFDIPSRTTYAGKVCHIRHAIA
jgi:hypothetical protein